eukprot:CAMPEP_0172312418 /NCGR_PEP_ID=MMETSP1058-20130122/17453_1 /TAXON_ID=83371 /ORGANISM="Detonula confervacea, Strain CCMP 353" /LENGTH=555 /DNA_ID=CAMNT_0013025865 /DNA_START=228 /DNA_END=1895 /DNA_ORIENTATION=-
MSRTLCVCGGKKSSKITATHRAAKNDVLRKNSRLSLAPMMEYTDRHFRAMVRLVSWRTLLHTEMVAADELVLPSNGKSGGGRGRERVDEDIKRNIASPHVQQLLGQSATQPEGPSVLQLGGNDASQLFQSAKTYHEYSQLQLSNASLSHSRCEYTALNLNCGCPSPAVSGKKRFGAALMKDPAHVTKLVRAIHDGVDGRLPVTVKCRIGLHDGDAAPFSREDYEEKASQVEYDELRKFVETVASDGIATDFQIHARIAVLGGNISPADNRKIPPLKYEYVRRLAREFPELSFVMNGGIHSLAQAREELDVEDSLAGVMVGRAFVADPWGFATADEVLYGDVHDGLDNHNDAHDSVAMDQRPRNRREVLRAYGRHVDYEERHAEPAEIRRSLVAACAHLFAGEANSKRFRMDLDEIAGRPERLEREAKAQVWSSAASTGSQASLSSAFSTYAPVASAGGAWDAMQAKDDARPSWDDYEPRLSELIMDAAHRHFGDEVLDRSRSESYDKKIWDEDAARKRRAEGDPVLFVGGGNGNIDNGEKVSGGVVDGWFNNCLN